MFIIHAGLIYINFSSFKHDTENNANFDLWDFRIFLPNVIKIDPFNSNYTVLFHSWWFFLDTV